MYNEVVVTKRDEVIDVLTIDEYIAKMKRTENMNEFDILMQAENLAKVIKSVTTYFNEYLTMETCDAEEIKLKHKMDKMAEKFKVHYPKSQDFLMTFYQQYRISIQKEVEKWLERDPYYFFYYSENDYSKLAREFCSEYKLKNGNLMENLSDIQVLFTEAKRCMTAEPLSTDLIHLDSGIVTWVLDTYRDYGVNLFNFAYEKAYSYNQHYIKYEAGGWHEESYYVNNYNHRYNSNPFELDRIYEDNKDRPYLQDKRGELEMLVMHEWLFDMAHDDDYWPEYVNMCVERRRVKKVQNINPLLPVCLPNRKYPPDVICNTEYTTLSRGKLDYPPQKDYIISINDIHAWENTESMETLIANMNNSIKENYPPELIELAAPLKTDLFDEEMFFTCCSLLEKKMRKYRGIKIAVVNGSGNHRTKPNSYISNIDDLIKLKVQFRERKIRIKFAIDFACLLKGKRSDYINSEILGVLTQMKNSIVCIHISNIKPLLMTSPKYIEAYDDRLTPFLQKFKYPRYDDFYLMLSKVFGDNQKRYIVPKNIENDFQLEELVDNLLRAGFVFCKGDNQI
ncbi:hypothetical protein J0B03_05535 [Alkalibacter rhizosphaerae]|uniref:Uncharacterized protein n=1 Tax=Alkalibacter rhizosphaerae TaxID=2815577 RepID=A0A974XIS2_9FIRM|nr:hypothetical protein [Alkalibacter rhizosphaerae]QSX09525.1 hypothetical protein J0B03_05535 [Alkalibacter rhizosphaerae]